MKSFFSKKQHVSLLILLLFIVSAIMFSCEKDEEIPPVMELKTGAEYVSTDLTLPRDTTITVGVTVEKTEDDLKTFNVSVAYDGSSTTTTKLNEDLTGDQKTGFNADIDLQTRNQAGTEKWYFTVTDVDGNIVQEVLTFTVN